MPPFTLPQDECDLLAITATQLYITQYGDTIMGPDGQTAAFTCSELGSRPDTDVRFMQNFVTACVALADQVSGVKGSEGFYAANTDVRFSRIKCVTWWCRPGIPC